MSAFLNFAGNQGVTFKDHGTGGGTSFTLDVNASTNSVMLSVGGVMQSPVVDYTVSGTTVTTTSSVTSGVEVLSYVIHKPGTAPTIQDNSISNAKMLDDAVGVAELSATGTASSSTFLRGDNAWATPSGGGWAYVSSVSASSSPAIAFTNMASGYDYHYVLERIVAATDTAALKMQLGVSGPTYRTSGYLGESVTVNNSGTSYGAPDTGSLRVVESTASQGLGTGTNEMVARFEVTLSDPANASTVTSSTGVGFNYGHAPESQAVLFGGYYTTAEAHTCVKWVASSGNIASGSIMQYRRSRS